MRLFIAIDIPEPARTALGELVTRLSALREPVKWVEKRPDASREFHVTLKFLGEASEARLPEIEAALGRAVAGTAPFEAAVRGAGGYPSVSHPRVVWAGLEAPPALPALVERIEAEVSPLGFPREKRPWSPHMTLGRSREGRRRARPRTGRAPAGAPGSDLAGALAAAASFDGGTIRLDHATLFSSVLSRTGSAYTVLHEAAFGG